MRCSYDERYQKTNSTSNNNSNNTENMLGAGMVSLVLDAVMVDVFTDTITH